MAVRDLWHPLQSSKFSYGLTFTLFLTCTHTHTHTHTHTYTHAYICTPQSYNGDRHLEKPNIQYDAGLRCGLSCSAHLQTRITSRCPSTGLCRDWARLFPFHSLLHPSSTTRTAAMLAVASFFTNYQLCIIPENAYTNKEGEKKSREVWFHWFFPTTIFEAEDDTTVGNKHLLGCVCSLKGLVLLPCLWGIRVFNTVLADIRGGLAGVMGFTVMIKLWPHILQSVQCTVIYHINVIFIILIY